MMAIDTLGMEYCNKFYLEQTSNQKQLCSLILFLVFVTPNYY